MMAGFVFGIDLQARARHRHIPRRVCRCALETSIPTSHREAIAGAEKAIKAGLQDGLRLLEVQFPPIASASSSAALSETLDANRRHVRELIRGFTAQWGERLSVGFPDDGEAVLARKAWDMDNVNPTFVISTIEKAADDKSKDLFFIVNPGFNVNEYLNIEKYDAKDRSVVVFNGELDRIRGGYYPRIFYPKLHTVSKRCLRNFEPVYYFKPLANRGVLLRTYPDPWRLYFLTNDKQTQLLIESNERPAYQDIERTLRDAIDNEKLNAP